MARIGERYIFRDQEFWAANGLIYIMDYRDKTPDDERFTVSTRAEFAARAIAINDENRVSNFKYGDERSEMSNLVVDMCACVKDAKKQGDPMDPEAARHVAMKNRKIIMAMNYNPQRHKTMTSPILGCGNDYAPSIPDMPKAPADAPVVGPDSAPDVSR